MRSNPELPSDIKFSLEVPYLLGFMSHKASLAATALNLCVQIEIKNGNTAAAEVLQELHDKKVANLSDEEFRSYQATPMPKIK